MTASPAHTAAPRHVPAPTVDSRARRVLRTAERAAWPAFCLLMGVWAIGYITWPFSSDQGVLSWVGRVMAEGGYPYRDAWEIRGPFPFFVYAGIASLFGPAQWPLRVVDLLIIGGGAWSVARIANQFAGRAAAHGAVALYLLWYASLGHHDTAQSDGWNAAMIAGVVAAMLARDGLPTVRHAVIAGALLGFSILSKPPYAVFLMLPAIVGIAQVGRRGGAWLTRFWASGTIALVLSAGSIVLWLYRGNALAPFIDIHLRWLLTRYTDVETGWLNRAQMAAIFLASDIFATAIAPAAVGVFVAWRKHSYAAPLFVAWVAGAVLTVMAQGNFYPYHWHPVYPALATLAGIGIAAIVTSARESPVALPRVIGVAVAAVAFSAAALRPLVHVYRSSFLAVGLLSRERFEAAEFGPYGETGLFARLTKYVRAHTAANETFLIWGSVPGIYYESERRAPTRFGYVAPLVNAQDDEFRRRYRREFLDRLAAAPPSYVATLAPSVCARARTVEERRLIGRVEERMKCVFEFPELGRFVDRYYAADTSIGPIAIYRRRAAVDPGNAGTASVSPPTSEPPAAR